MIKVGDYIRQKPELKYKSSWYSTETYRVIRLYDNYLILDRKYPPEIPTFNEIHSGYVDLDIQSIRLAKLKEIFG